MVGCGNNVPSSASSNVGESLVPGNMPMGNGADTIGIVSSSHPINVMATIAKYRAFIIVSQKKVRRAVQHGEPMMVTTIH